MSDGGGAVATGNVTVTVLPPPTNVVWIKGGSGSWNDPANWNPARLPSVKDTVTIANSASWTIALDGDQACSNLYASMTASGGLTLSGSSQIRQLTLGGGEIDRAAGRTLAFASTVSLLLLSDLTITGAVSVAYGVGINGIVDDGPATHGIELPGGRYLALNGANTFGGGVTVGDGAKLRVGHASALGAAGGVGLLAGIGCTIDHAATGADLSNATVV